MNKITWTKEEVDVYNNLLLTIKNISHGGTSHDYYIAKLERLTSVLNMRHRGLMIGEVDYDNI